ncbi:cystathionine gamma-synthase [Ochrobactrum sp. MYb15]|uniref:trans-sulfuration enzyme family protein n=1 Tax=Brucella pituitosa TaxID=571256 RepID=UPI000CFCC3BA|nr:cystathionine gamma-synthase [Ochrobactrum sp. MYb19]PRA52637.1 cystathionine gamma-synthase [Ochrobactrum sp. MYb68]PRA63420.1 cystathionine gamma-synthase [Ochrobactrum sp. MYb18]PRA73689.1 cystathionine gamma-synthase [Brucella thiophenivorans]PRA88415.1 cystathionine gamma-synthase [Ochrobactrum sp. MYb14]PRA94746.1 cystathionine gamma-synthase [Ochrobactrum sp. MYb15]
MTNKLLRNQAGFATRAIHVGQEPDPLTGAVIPPIYHATTYVQDGIGASKGYDYSRSGNPTRNALERCLADLEGAEVAFAFPSGLAAAATLLEALPAGSSILAHNDLYGGVYRLLADVRPLTADHKVRFVDFSDESALSQAVLDHKPSLLWFETPSNPTLRIVDLSLVAKLGAEAGAITVCDSTFSSPAGQRPIEHGIHVVVHSATKMLNGHSDLLGGVVAVSAHAPAKLGERIKYLQNALGSVMSPTDCALLHRSLKTLEIRSIRQSETALKLANILESKAHELGLSRVVYPGLTSHPQHAMAARQMLNFGCVVSVEVKGDLARVERILTSTRYFHFAVSLGSVESLIQHPFSLTHAVVPEDQKNDLGIGPQLIRISVGLEDPEDLEADLVQALINS